MAQPSSHIARDRLVLYEMFAVRNVILFMLTAMMALMVNASVSAESMPRPVQPVRMPAMPAQGTFDNAFSRPLTISPAMGTLLSGFAFSPSMTISPAPSTPVYWNAFSRPLTIEIGKETCAPADLNCDGVVNVSDLLILFDNWGSCDDCGNCPADLNSDCVVNVSDLLILFDNWG